MTNPVLKDFSATGNITVLNSNLGGPGAPTAGSSLEINTEGRSLLAVQVTGTWTGTLTLQATVNGENWVTVGGPVFMSVASRTTSASSISSNGVYQADVSGYIESRITASAAITGTAVLHINSTSFALLSGVNAASTNLIGDVSGNVRSTSGGLSAPNRLLAAAAGLNATLVKATAGRVYKITGYNAATTLRYLKLYNKATAPAPGTDTPVVTLALPPSAAFDFDFGLLGQFFSAGIGYGLTTGNPDADIGALTAGDVVAINVWSA